MTIRVLLVDDTLETLESLQIMYSLDSTFQIVDAVGSIESAWDVLNREPIDMVSIDIQLGEQNGFNLCQQVRAAFKDVFIVICSLNADAEIVEISRERGANLFVPKPMTIADLRRILSSYQHSRIKSMNLDAVLQHLSES